MTVHGTEPYNAEPPRAALAERVLTPLEAFYCRNHGPVPALDAAAWRLTVDGLVARPVSWTLADLRDRFTAHSETATLQCAGNRRAGLVGVRDIPGEAPWGPTATATARWTGVRLADVLDDAGVDPAATDVAFLGTDVSDQATPPQEFGGSIPLRKARMPEVLLAWEMNGEPLAPVHGAPVRVVVPGYIGARSVKWLGRIVVSDHPSENNFVARDYKLYPPEATPEPVKPENYEPLKADLIIRNADLADVLALAGQSDVPATGALQADAHINGTVGSPAGSAAALRGRGRWRRGRKRGGGRPTARSRTIRRRA